MIKHYLLWKKPTVHELLPLRFVNGMRERLSDNTQSAGNKHFFSSLFRLDRHSASVWMLMINSFTMLLAQTHRHCC